MTSIIFDTETTGLPEKNISINTPELWPHIIQLSYLVINDSTHQILAEENMYIDIDNSVEIGDDSSAIHGITKDVLKNKPLVPMREALTKFKKDFDKCMFSVAHNIRFDNNMIMVECKRNNMFIELLKRPCCTMLRGKDICNILKHNKYGNVYKKPPKLSELHYHLFSHDIKDLHNAFVDIIVCIRCYYMMTQNRDITRTNRYIRHIFRTIRKID